LLRLDEEINEHRVELNKMKLKDTIKKDLHNAKKEADRLLIAILKLLWCEIGYLTVDKKDDDESVLAMLKKEARKRKDAIEIYKKAGDEQRTESEEYELKVISGYLPEEMGEEEVRKVVEEIRKEWDKGSAGQKAGATPAAGRLIGAAMKKLGGRADGKLVAKIVNSLSF
jgi:uncharacterized protein